jgi:hypothetical protein
MPTTFYLDGTTLSDSTAVYTDAALTTCATDGFYSDGIVSRELVSCVLQPEVVCAACGVPCGGALNPPGGDTGLYLVNVETGNTDADVGAVVIHFQPYQVPDGIRVMYDGVTYNKLSSEVFGYKAASDSDHFTLLGVSTSGCAPDLLAGPYPLTYTLDVFEFDGTGWDDLSTTRDEDIVAGDLAFDSVDGNWYTMVIPKLTRNPSLLEVEVIAPCASTGWDIAVTCPAALPSFSSNTTLGASKASSALACADTGSATFYRAGYAGGTGNTVTIYDWVFSDSFGENVLPSGWYKGGGVGSFEVDSNGVVITITAC